MNLKTKIAIVLASLAIGFGAGKFSNPSKVETITKTESNTTKNKIQDKDKITSISETINKDGTKTKITVITDKTKTKIDSETNTKSSSQTVVTRDIGLTIQALAFMSLNKIDRVDSYGILIKKRVFSNISMSIQASTDKKIGVGIGMDF